MATETGGYPTLLILVVWACVIGGIWLGYTKFRDALSVRGKVGAVPSVLAFVAACLLSSVFAIWFAGRMFLLLTRWLSKRYG